MIRQLFSALAVTVAVLTVAGVTVLAPQPAAAQSMSLNGDWRGQASGNVVRVREEGGGIYVAAVTNNAGQSEPLFYPRTRPGEYRYTFPDGNQSVVTAGSGSIRVVNPDGWNDTFYPVNRAPTAPARTPPPAYTPSVRTEGWPMPASPGADAAILDAMARADQAAHDAMVRALGAQPTP